MNIAITKMQSLIFTLIMCFSLLTSCAIPDSSEIENTEQSLIEESAPETTVENESQATSFIYEGKTYNLSEGAETPEGMAAAIKINEKYYEGKEYYYSWVSYGDEKWAGTDYRSYIMDNSNFPYSLKDIPEGCPIIKLSQNDTYKLISEHGIFYHYFINIKSQTTIENNPTEPGIYFLVAVTGDVQGIPWFSETFVPPETYTEYALQYQYVFAVVIE